MPTRTNSKILMFANKEGEINSLIRVILLGVKINWQIYTRVKFILFLIRNPTNVNSKLCDHFADPKVDSATAGEEDETVDNVSKIFCFETSNFQFIDLYL